MRTDKIIARLQAIECSLSPENLSCDGMASLSEQRRRFRVLQAERRDLITELGREPRMEELYPRMSPIGANFS